MMERDIRRDRGQWRGCHSFKDVICDGDQGMTAKRNGGLKMGQTYYYYYELDGATETHDPSLPSTSACPYLPGQRVNTLFVPVEQSSRKRSASVNSAREGEFRTMNPDDKFVTPRAAPPVPTASPAFRLGTSHTLPPSLTHKRSARSLSPNPSWAWSPRKLFTRKSGGGAPSKDSISISRSSSRSSDRPAAWIASTSSSSSASTASEDRMSLRSCDGGSGSRSRDISPESLRRFLVSDVEHSSSASVASTTIEDPRPSIVIPEDIAEENEDDDNFATSAASEGLPYSTVLSPPPTQRTFLSSASGTTVHYFAAEDSRPHTPAQEQQQHNDDDDGNDDDDDYDNDQEREDLIASFPAAPTRTPPKLPSLSVSAASPTRSRFSTDSSILLTPNSPVTAMEEEPRSPQSTASSNDIPSFYHSEAEDDDDETDDNVSVFGLPTGPAAASSTSTITAAADLLLESGAGGYCSPSSFSKSLLAAFPGYSLPEAATSGGDDKQRLEPSSAVVAASGAAPGAGAVVADPVVGGSSPLLASAAGGAVDAGLSSLVLELGWMADVIGKNSP